MGFHWYIDIEEKEPRVNLSVGPIEFINDEGVEVPDLVSRINSAFQSHYDDGRHDTLYTIRARFAPMPSSTSGGGATGATKTAHHPGYKLAKQHRQFLVQYEVQNLDNRSFRLKFATGEHGQTAQKDIAGSHPGQLGGAPPRAEITVKNMANIQPLVMKHCKVTSVITDKPPVPPDIVFIPYKGKNNKLLLLFAPNLGHSQSVPIPLATSDSTFIIKEYYSQKDMVITADQVGSLTEKITYASDDPVRTYEIFRIEEKPTSYASFIGNKLATVVEQLAPGKFSTGASYLDTISPNVKYYYCARSIDRHQNISNPTFIFELELVDNAGQLYLMKKLFTFESTPQQPVRSARRLMAIEPAHLQRVLGSQPLPDGALHTAPQSNSIGAAADSVWDKKFKIRLRSKKTGKKMDLNITFKNTGVTNP